MLHYCTTARGVVAVTSTIGGVLDALASGSRSHGGTLERFRAQERHLEWAMICKCSTGEWSVVWRATKHHLGREKSKGLSEIMGSPASDPTLV